MRYIKNEKEIQEGRGYAELVNSFSDQEFRQIHKVVSDFNKQYGWSLDSAVLLAYLVCEDANAHIVAEAIDKAWIEVMKKF